MEGVVNSAIVSGAGSASGVYKRREDCAAPNGIIMYEMEGDWVGRRERFVLAWKGDDQTWEIALKKPKWKKTLFLHNQNRASTESSPVVKCFPVSGTATRMGALLFSQEHGDIKFVCTNDNQVIYAHKSILSLCSPLFNAAFSGRWTERSEWTIACDSAV